MLNKQLILILLIALYQVIAQNTIKPRNAPACALVQNKIFCYGGNTAYKIISNQGQYTDAVSELVSLDLTPFNNFTTFNESMVQWNIVTNYQGAGLLQALFGASGATILSDESMVIWGGNPNSGGINLNNPFLNYNPQANTWRSLPLPNGNNYTSQTVIVNIGNDQIWTWGGSVNNTRGAEVANVVNIFDFKSNSWINQGFFTGPIRTDFSATLASNGLIYLIAGTYRYANSTSFDYVNPNTIYTYNTTSLGWGVLVAQGNIPTRRVSHTVVESSDHQYLLLYGGRFSVSSGSSSIDDIYYVYNIAQNNFTNVKLPTGAGNNNRYSHFATIYNQDKLLLAFGYSDTNTPADYLSVLNVANVYSPVWVAAPTNPPPTNNGTENNSTNDGGSGGGGLSTDKLIPTVIVVVVVVIGGIIGAFFFFRHRKNKKRKQFVLEAEDPRRKTFELQENALFDEKNNNINNNANIANNQNNHSVHSDGLSSTVETVTTKPFLNNGLKDQSCKPFENNNDDTKANLIKPFEENK
ncbi:unnamed protein product [Cunninghamella blakesleeana]